MLIESEDIKSWLANELGKLEFSKSSINRAAYLVKRAFIIQAHIKITEIENTMNSSCELHSCSWVTREKVICPVCQGEQKYERN